MLISRVLLRTALLAALWLCSSSGCRQPETGPSTNSRIEPATVDFGWVQTPPLAPFTTAVTREVTITNAANTELSGEVSIHLDGEAPHEPALALTRPETGPRFAIPPGDTLIFEFTATVVSNTPDGSYSGTIEFGPACGSVPLALRVRASQ